MAAAARSAGYKVQLLDLCFEEDVVSAVQWQIASSPPDVIGISVRNLDNGLYLAPVSYLPQLKMTVEACRSRTDVPIVLGGCGFSLMPGAILRMCNLTLGIVGGGEAAFPQLLCALESRSNWRSVTGLVWLEGNIYRQNPPARIACLDELPWPARDLFDERYRLQRDPASYANVETKRGCRFCCLYCTYPFIQGKTIRMRSPDRVAEEVSRLAAESGLTRMFFVDNVFNDPSDHALAVCQALIKRKVHLSWGCNIRPGQVSVELVSAMARAGCRWVELGLDAVSEPMLRVLQKGFDLEAIRQSLYLFKTAGIKTSSYILLGAPGENRRTLEETLLNLETLDPPRVYLLPGIRIYPGTPLADMIDGVWREDSHLLDPTFYLSPEMGDSELDMVFEWTVTHSNWFVPGGPTLQEVAVRKAVL